MIIIFALLRLWFVDDGTSILFVVVASDSMWRCSLSTHKEGEKQQVERGVVCCRHSQRQRGARLRRSPRKRGGKLLAVGGNEEKAGIDFGILLRWFCNSLDLWWMRLCIWVLNWIEQFWFVMGSLCWNSVRGEGNQREKQWGEVGPVGSTGRKRVIGPFFLWLFWLHSREEIVSPISENGMIGLRNGEREGVGWWS